MTISQPSSSQGSGLFLIAALGRLILAVTRWQERRRVEAELVRLLQVGDYLLRDVGLDPKLARLDPSAAAAKFLRRS